MNTEKVCEVYCHTSPSGRRYVGWTSRGVAKRWYKHVWSANRGSKLPLHRAIRKYGAETFTTETLERMSTPAGASRAERLWIKELGTFGAAGYNATRGGEGILGLVMSPEARAKMSVAAQVRGISSETQAKMSAARRGKTRGPHTPETRAKIAAARRGQALSPEHRAKISAKTRGRELTTKQLAHLIEMTARNVGRVRTKKGA